MAGTSSDPPIKTEHVLPVRYTLQGHPESPRLWATMIHGILTGPSLKFSSAAHKPCLYHGSVDTIPIFILRQADDFDVSAPSEDIANKLFVKNTDGSQTTSETSWSPYYVQWYIYYTECPFR